MAQPARHRSPVQEDAPSLDPGAIEHRYLRERARRRARIERRSAARRSNARFFLLVALLVLLTVFLALTAWREIQQIFGV